MASSSLPMKHGLVDITDFLPPLDDGDDPREDDDFADLVAEIRDGKIDPPAPIRVLVAQDGVRLADRPAWKQQPGRYTHRSTPRPFFALPRSPP